MRGCLTLPFRLLLLGLLGVGLVLGWSYRDDLRRRIHAWTVEPSPEVTEGRADPSLVSGARRRIAGLGTAGRDSVVLTAAELARLIAGEVAARLPQAMHSVQVRLARDEVEVRALLDLRVVKPPLALATRVLGDREWLDAQGRLIFRRAGVAEWEVERVRVHGLPIPRQLVEGMLRQLTGAGSPGGAAIALSPVVGGLRVAANGLVLYGPNPPRR